jgi:hypothetical protein
VRTDGSVAVKDGLAGSWTEQVSGVSKLALQGVRIPLAELAGVDLADVRGVTLAFDGEGTLFLADVMIQAEPDVT